MKSTKFIRIALSVSLRFFSMIRSRKAQTALLLLAATFCFWTIVTFRTGASVNDRIGQKNPDSLSTLKTSKDELKIAKVNGINEEAHQFTPGSCDTIGPIEVESTGGITIPTAYLTLQAAFTAINNGTHTGTITIDVCGNTTETATASLNASGSGSANYTSVTISPAGGAARTISGSIAGAALVELNGADNVTIDGLNSGGNSLTISNTSTSSTSGTSTIRLVADATGNTITNCSILGSSTTGLTTNGGTIFISTAASGGNGNDNNTFSNNKIGPAGTNLPTKAVYANGSTSSTASYNNNVTFSNNEIFDYFSAGSASVGIYLSGGNDNWTISNNKFYQTAARTQTTGSLHAAINVASSTGNTSHTFSGNIIGFANATGTGTYQVTLASGGRFAGILVSSAGTGSNYNIQNNTITSINIAGAGSGTSTSAGFAAILMGSGSTATIGGNTIGSTTTNPAISYSSSSSSASDVYGIYFFPSANVTISNNTIAGITATNSSTGSVVIYGIRAFTTSSATNTIQNNIVGSSSAPIQNNASSTSSRVIGIYSQSGASVVTGNTVRNLTMSAGNTGTGTSASVIGILSDNTSATNNNISQNTIHSLSNTNATAAVVVAGLVYSSRRRRTGL
ncbi:MAG: hypothetical protein D6735_05500 [Acidobacteria bacterium]|nr:MAG: hypothetical protein D6735_05500 [Acidobacteriota bacterium]